MPPPVTRAFSLSSPGEALSRPAAAKEYSTYSSQDALAASYLLPPQFLQNIRPEAGALPETPLIVFINARSGGRSGPELALKLGRAIGRVQVFDLSHHRPDKVLSQLWENFKAAIAAGVPNAAVHQSRLRILVAGGDGTIAWVLGCIKALKLHPTPPVAIMPLGTGNDLSRTFGWGAAFDKAWIKGYTGIYSSLLRVKKAQVEDLDCWAMRMWIPRKELLGTLPHALQVVDMEPPPPPLNDPGALAAASPRDVVEAAASDAAQHIVAKGVFWNYISVGLDARAAHNFHQLREEHPKLAANRMLNQFWYSFFSCSSGWFCCTKPVSAKVDLEVQRPGSDDWIKIKVPPSVKALVVLNLQSYAGGRNLWGPHSPNDSISEGPNKMPIKEPSFNDGQLEVVGLMHGTHTAAVMASKGDMVHAKRLCQASGIRMALRAQYVRPDGSPSHAYLQIDGEPWMQDVPSSKDNESILVEVRHAGVSKLLHNHLDLGGNPNISKLLHPYHATPAAAAPPQPSRLNPNASSAMVSMAGTAADSEAVQVGSEQVGSEQYDRAASFQSSTWPGDKERPSLSITNPRGDLPPAAGVQAVQVQVQQGSSGQSG